MIRVFFAVILLTFAAFAQCATAQVLTNGAASVSAEEEVWDRQVPAKAPTQPVVIPSREQVNWPVVVFAALAVAVFGYLIFILCRKGTPAKVNSTETILLSVQQYNLRLSMLIVVPALAVVAAGIAMIWMSRPIRDSQPKAHVIQANALRLHADLTI